jgi:probable F420-dependent oxidoreductase
MRIAVQFGPTDQTADPGQVAHEAEARGFEGIFFPEHTHIPTDMSKFPYPGAEHRILHARRFLSPWVSMSWAAARTKTLTVGTCVGLPAEHNAINLAKSLASIDLLSNGRVVYGFGFGWHEQEMIDHGVDPKRRRATVRERMLAVKTLWRDEQAAFSGEFVDFPSCWQWPKPPEPSRVPLLLGAKGTDQVLDHVIDYCDGWMPSLRGGVEVFAEAVQRLRARAADKGRDPASLELNVICADRSVAVFEALQALGVRRVILHTPYASLDEVLRTLDAYAAEFLPHFR